MPVQSQSIGTLFVELLLDASGVDRGTAEAKTKISKFGDALDGLAKKVDQTITAAFKAAAVAAAALGTATVLVGATFEKQMSKVAAISGATAEELAALTEEARRIGRETAFSATDAAMGMEALAQAGFTAEQIITATAEAMNLAGASGVSLDTATGLVAATLTQFSLSASEAGRVSDVFAAAAQSSLFTVEDLGVAMRYAGSVGAAFGMSLEETTAAVAQFRNAGLTGEQAGTNFRSMLEALANPTKRAMDELEALGLTVEEVNPALHSFDEIMQSLADSGMNTAQAFSIFGTVSGANVARLTQAWEGAKSATTGYQQTLEGLESANGIAGRTFSTMADNVSGRFEQLTSQVEDLFLTIYDSISGPLKRLVEQLTLRVGVLASAFGSASSDATTAMDAIVDAVLSVVDAFIKLLPYFPMIAAGMLTALVASKGIQYASAAVKLADAFGIDLVAGIGKAITALRAMGVAQAAFTVTGLGLVLAGLAALTAAVVQLGASYMGTADAARKLAGQIEGAEAFAKLGEEEQARIGKLLALTQDEVKARIARGDAVSREERALLSYSAAQAYSATLSGELVELQDRLGQTSTKTASDVLVQAAYLDEQSRAAGTLADRLEYLASQYQDAGFSATVNDAAMGGQIAGVQLFSGVLSKASEELGYTVSSLEELSAIAKTARLQEEQFAATSRNLSNVLADQTAAANEAAAASEGRTDQSAKTQMMVKREAEAEEEAERAAKKEAAAQRDAAKAAGEHALALYDLSVLVDNIVHDKEAEAEAMGLIDELRKSQSFDDEIEAYAKLNASVQTVTDSWGTAYESFTGMGGIYEAPEPGPWEKFGDAVKGVGEGILGAFGKVFDKIKAGIEGLSSSASGAAMSMLSDLSGLGAVTSLGGATDLVGLFTGGADAAAQAAQEARDKAEAAAQARFEQTGTSVRSQVEAGTLTQEEANAILVTARADRDAMMEDAAAAFESASKVGGKEQSAAAAKAVEEAVAAQVAFVKGFVAALPLMLDALIAALPELFTAIAAAIPKIVETVADHIPDLIIALADGLIAMLSNAGEIVAAILTNLPDIIAAIIVKLPEIAIALVLAIGEVVWKLAKNIGKAIGEALLEVVTLGLAKTSFDKGKKGHRKNVFSGIAEVFSFGQANTGFDDGNGSRSAAGIEYVPSTMSTVLEPGEAVLDAATNASRLRGYNYPAPAPQSAPASRSEMPTRIAFEVDGRVLDEVQFDGVRRGSMPKMRATLRRARGGRVGFSRGRFNAWSR